MTLLVSGTKPFSKIFLFFLYASSRYIIALRDASVLVNRNNLCSSFRITVDTTQFSAEIFRKKIIPPLSFTSWVETSVRGYLGGLGCLAANIQYYISAYGDVAPCDFTPLSFGNIRTEPLKKIWMKLIRHPAFNHRCSFCRMQHSEFRRFYIDPIPDNATLPYNINKLPRVDYRKEKVP